MGLLGIMFDVESHACWVHWCFKQDHISSLESVRVAVEWQLLHSSDTFMNSNDTVTAVIPVTNRNPPGVKEDESSVNGTETRGVCYGWLSDEGRENGL